MHWLGAECVLAIGVLENAMLADENGVHVLRK
jgi:hypothetical protein